MNPAADLGEWILTWPLWLVVFVADLIVLAVYGWLWGWCP